MGITRFSEVKKRKYYALQVYLILICAAHMRQTLTYGIVAKRLGFEGAGVLAQILDHLLYWCIENKLPPLTSIVVSKSSGRAGEGFIGSSDPISDREAVYEFNWYDIVPPSPDELHDVRAAHTSMTN